MANIFNGGLLLLFLFKAFAIKLPSASEPNNPRSHKRYFLQKSPTGDDNDLLLKVAWTEWTENEEKVFEGCKIYKGKQQINKVLRSSKKTPVRTLPETQMQNLLRDCEEFKLRKMKNKREAEDPGENTISYSHHRILVIFPGTKWCGLGNKAKGYNDLGSDWDTDQCCRAHDHCNEYLRPGETTDNLTNKSWLPLLGCKCDHEFYDCLTEVNSVASNIILNLYFNILNKKCFELDYPLTDQCKSYYTFMKIVCSEYERNTTAPKVYQLVLSKKYTPVLGPLTTESTETTL